MNSSISLTFNTSIKLNLNSTSTISLYLSEFVKAIGGAGGEGQILVGAKVKINRIFGETSNFRFYDQLIWVHSRCGSLINLMECWKKDWFIYSWFDGQLVRRRLVWRMVDQCLLWACSQPYSARSSSVSSKELIDKLDRGLINYLVRSFSPFSSFTSITIESWSQELNLRANWELIVRLSGSCTDRIMNVWTTKVLGLMKYKTISTLFQG